MTLNYQNRETQKENAIKYKPILDVCGVDNHQIICLMREVGLSFQGQERNSEKIQFNLLLKNKGRGETYNVVLKDFYVKEINWDKDTHLYSNIGGNDLILVLKIIL